MLYVSATQVGAIAPFNLSAPATNIQVTYNGQTSSAFTMPVVSAAPSVYSINGTGGGYGILNQDGSVNTSVNTASVGSVVTFYATGFGQTSPASLDGTVTSVLPYPVPLQPVTVAIDGQPAEVVYAGAAPSQPAGIMQVNAVVPANAYGYNLPVLLSVGNVASPNILQLSVQ